MFTAAVTHRFARSMFEGEGLLSRSFRQSFQRKLHIRSHLQATGTRRTMMRMCLLINMSSLSCQRFFILPCACHTRNILLKKIPKALKIKRNIHNKLPLTRSPARFCLNSSGGEEKNLNERAKERKAPTQNASQKENLFCVHNFRV